MTRLSRSHPVDRPNCKRPSIWGVRPLIFVAVLIICSATLTACTVNIGDTVRGSGNVTSEDRALSGITGVALTTIGELTIEKGEQESLRVEAEDNLLQYFQTTVNGGVLTIETEPGVSVSATKPVRYYLTVSGLESIKVSSSGNVSAPSLQAGHFEVNISSSGNVDIAGLEADSLEVMISSSGNLTIGGGQVASQEIKLSSSGDYEAGDMQSGAADATVSSSGSATIWVTEKLEANLSSSGNLKYYGAPFTDVNESSSGEVTNLGQK